MNAEKRKAQKKAVIAHNKKVVLSPFDHAAERKCKLTSGERAMRLLARFRPKSLTGPARYHEQALFHGFRSGKHCLSKKEQV